MSQRETTLWSTGWVIAAVLLLLVSATAATRKHEANQTLYVSPRGSDANSCSYAAPCASISRAAELAVPGSTVHVAPGTYHEAIITNTSGNSAARIRYISDTRWGGVLRASGTVWSNNGSYVDIVGFDVSGTGRLGIWNTGSFVRVMGNRVHDIPAPCASIGGAGIEHGNYAATDDESIGNLVYNIGVGSNCNTVHGIYHSQLRGRIVNNIVYRTDGWGIHLWHAAQYLTIANNTVFNNRQGGIIVGDGDAPGGIVDDYTVVTNNIAVANGGYGISEFGATGSHNLYSHNLVHANASGGIQLRHGVQTNTINADPQFVNFQPNGGGDYHLKPTSPAIHAGTQDYAPSDDYDGGARLPKAAWDIGAYAAGAAPSAWPWYWGSEEQLRMSLSDNSRSHAKP